MVRSASAPIENGEVADLLERIAALLEAQRDDPHRVRAYRNAARTARALERPVAELLDEGGRGALEALPGIGRSIAALLDAYLHTGRSLLLERLEGQVSPEDLFATLPGVGEVLAGRIHDALGAETLEELEVAAHDGRLEGVPGVGPRRAAGIRDSVTAVLDRSTRRRARRRRRAEHDAGAPAPAPGHAPGVATLLAVDADYRQRAARGALKTIAPRRFNPQRRSWLPILHVERDGWVFTAMFSNTARAHELHRTRDWVVIYFERDGDEDQCTVVTETHGPLAGGRVVRGRERECAALAAQSSSA